MLWLFLRYCLPRDFQVMFTRLLISPIPITIGKDRYLWEAQPPILYHPKERIPTAIFLQQRHVPGNNIRCWCIPPVTIFEEHYLISWRAWHIPRSMALLWYCHSPIRYMISYRGIYCMVVVFGIGRLKERFKLYPKLPCGNPWHKSRPKNLQYSGSMEIAPRIGMEPFSEPIFDYGVNIREPSSRPWTSGHRTMSMTWSHCPCFQPMVCTGTWCIEAGFASFNTQYWTPCVGTWHQLIAGKVFWVEFPYSSIT